MRSVIVRASAPALACWADGLGGHVQVCGCDCDQCLEEVLHAWVVGHSLWVPLDSDAERVVGELQRLDHSVRRLGAYFQRACDTFHGLVVLLVDLDAGRADGLSER